jgi:uncharacterized membrane protein YgcG
MPTHHLHISTSFMFITALFVVGFVAVVFAFIRSMKNDRLAAEAAIERAKADAAYRLAHPASNPAPTKAEVDAFMQRTPYAEGLVRNQYQAPAPAYSGYAPVAPVYAHDPLTGLATGMMLGSMMGHSHHDTTTIIHDAPAPAYYSEPAPSYSPSSSSDSGFSYSSDSSSSSYDSGGSSSGFDASW